MSMISHTMTQVGTIYTQTKDKHGDYSLTNGTAVNCRFRYITGIEKGQNKEDIISEAIIWLEPTVTVVEGSIIQVEDKYWRVKTLVRARKMSGTTVEFFKCFVDKYAL